MQQQRAPDIVLTLDLPPSANKSWRPGTTADGVAAMFKRAPYKAWLPATAWSVKVQRRGITLPHRYEILIVLPDTRRDPDNSIKPLQDACQKGGAIANDKHCRRLVLEVDETRKEQNALIHLWGL